jgi:catechol 2,3-dioxygenase-like lactoylglutathione lyase family enzyme
MTIRNPKEVLMHNAFIEHVNLTVADPERSAKLMADLFGWHIRWQGASLHGGRTVHVGDDKSYIAYYAEQGAYRGPWRKGDPLQHLAIVVDDLDDVERRVIAAGLMPFSHGDYDPGRRFYFFDYDGIEYEMVSYAPVARGRGDEPAELAVVS